ncbi:MAG TPA: rRNA maturation RNase YbeY [Bacillota bacterium]|jgi:probable rRNA maturation factor|nr:rRNA maturation RNase YbeY [Bacillota bacterium]HOL09638.1 rRNA maturation RNase YbeY [Bacillota bacterium]HPO98616.1 rRNA maturation RNase YbeY [Bacillota bacterium]
MKSKGKRQMPVLLNDIQKKVQLSHEQLDLIENLIDFGLKRVQKENAEVSLILVDDDYIHELNLEYRNQDRPTDVLSFAMQEHVETLNFQEQTPIPELLGDIYISVERAVEQAENFGHSVERELGYLAVHGLMHLLGHDHQDEEDTAAMRAAEEEIMKQFSLGRSAF